MANITPKLRVQISTLILLTASAAYAENAGNQQQMQRMLLEQQQQAIAAAQQAQMQAKLAAAETARQKQAAELFRALGKKQGKIVVLIPRSTKGKGATIKGVKGFKKVRMNELKDSDFGHLSKAAVYERHSDGSISTREVLIVKRNGRAKVLDETIYMKGEKRRKLSRAQLAKLQKQNAQKAHRQAMRAKTSSRSVDDGDSQMISSQDYSPQVVQEGIVIPESPEVDAPEDDIELPSLAEQWLGKKPYEHVQQPDEGVAEYVHVLGGDQVIAVVGEESETQQWASMDVKGEPPCDTSQNVNSWFSSLTMDQIDINCGKEEETTSRMKARPGEVWFGAAPICSISTDICAQNGMALVGTDPWGEALIGCAVGEKVLCRPLEPGESLGKVYLGKPPFCDASIDTCDSIGMVNANTSKCDSTGKNCCTSGKYNICKAPAKGKKVTTWIGKAPFCAATKSDCSDRNMKYVKSAPKDCWSGVKVLCETK